MAFDAWLHQWTRISASTLESKDRNTSGGLSEWPIVLVSVVCRVRRKCSLSQ